MKAHFILYVSDQERSTAFYSAVLGMHPTLNVRGMTEFTLDGSSILGLMPESGICIAGDLWGHNECEKVPHLIKSLSQPFL
jgi:catechol 2,3-dioxygenase-like lactoylglutathione lyase family enzyme